MKPFCWSTAHASSSVTRFMRSRISSGTLGRPSAKRSPCQSGVYLITSSEVKNPCCALALGTIAATSTRDEITQEIRLSFRVMIAVAPIFSSRFVGFKPSRSRDLCFSSHLFIHLHPKAWLVRYADVSLLNDFTFLHPVLPKIGKVDPVPFANQEIRNRSAKVRRGHHAHRRYHTMRRHW